jgi:ribosomal 50S subunit-associated protein YjgA (DUF615 family)
MRRDDSDTDTDTEPERLSRADVKRANRVVEETLARLSTSLFELGPRRIRALDLPESVLDALTDAFPLTNARARHRQLGLVRVALRSADWGAIQERVARLVEGRAATGGIAGAEVSEGSEALWLARLLGEGFAGLDAFCAEFPRADRTRLTELIREVDRNSHERRAKAERKLATTIRSFLASRVR